MEAWTGTSHGRDKALRYLNGGVTHAVLGASVLWKVFKLTMPLRSTGTEARVWSLAVKCAKKIRTFLQHLGLPYPNPAPTYEDNTAVFPWSKLEKITNCLRYIDMPLCYMCDEHNL